MNDIALAIRGNKATLCVTSHSPREARQYLLLLLLLHVLDRGRRLEDPSNPTKSTCKVHQAWTLRLWDSTVSHATPEVLMTMMMMMVMMTHSSATQRRHSAITQADADLLWGGHMFSPCPPRTYSPKNRMDGWKHTPVQHGDGRTEHLIAQLVLRDRDSNA